MRSRFAHVASRSVPTFIAALAVETRTAVSLTDGAGGPVALAIVALGLGGLLVGLLRRRRSTAQASRSTRR